MSKGLSGVLGVLVCALGGSLVLAADEEPAVIVVDGAIAATELGPMRGELPAAMAGWVVKLDVVEPVGFEVLAGRVGMAAGVKVAIEERPGRIADGAAELAPAPALSINYQGLFSGLLDRVSVLSGYEWEWRNGELVFYRYWDVAQAAPGQDMDEGGGVVAGERRAEWIVDASWTLREVLERWSGRAGWTLVWKAGNEYTLGAGARFDGEFLEVVDRLLAGSAVSRALVTTAYVAALEPVFGGRRCGSVVVIHRWLMVLAA